MIFFSFPLVKCFKTSKCPPFLLGKMRCKSLIRCIGLLQLRRGSEYREQETLWEWASLEPSAPPGPTNFK